MMKDFNEGRFEHKQLLLLLLDNEFQEFTFKCLQTHSIRINTLINEEQHKLGEFLERTLID